VLKCDKLVDGRHYRSAQQYLLFHKSALVDDTRCDGEEDADDGGRRAMTKKKDGMIC
jgi:hypothetical protein